jgi:hypothetical protein
MDTLQTEKINDVKVLVYDIETNLICCEVIRDFINPRKNNKYGFTFIEFDNYLSYLVLLFRNHFDSAILTLDSLLRPNGQELISPYNKLLLSNKEKKELNLIRDKYIKMNCHKIRNEIIAHKKKSINVDSLIRYENSDEIFDNIKIIFNELNAWVSKYWGNALDDLNRESYENVIKVIIKLIRKYKQVGKNTGI